jgi:hypothetical protein
LHCAAFSLADTLLYVGVDAASCRVQKHVVFGLCSLTHHLRSRQALPGMALHPQCAAQLVQDAAIKEGCHGR